MQYNNVKGTRDFLPLEMQKRSYIFNTIIDVYRSHGFLQIETPALENLSTLMGKYGEEGDKLLFRVLNSGSFLESEDISELENLIAENSYNKASAMLCEKGLRYDLTVPFARFVVNHQNDITFPFKRYQIQPVWRADRPQKGRYREFYQCDADIIGSNSLLNEVELVEIMAEVFEKLHLDVSIKINNRKLLASMADIIGKNDLLTAITVAIDKLDKIGIEGVKKELIEDGLNDTEVSILLPILDTNGTNDEKLIKIKSILGSNEVGKKGIEELEYVLNKCKVLGIGNIEFDVTLARGLNYYTGAIFEVKAQDVKIGSITGGGRYDNLTGIFGLKDMSGVGISFGADRIYDCLEEKDLFPKKLECATDILFVNFGEKESEYCLKIARSIRKNNLCVEIYPENSKIQKQMKYANARHIPYVILIGEKEIENHIIVVKNMISGEQSEVKEQDIVSFFNK